MNHPYIELTADHVGKALIHAFDRNWSVSSFIGRVLPGDVGKRVYLVSRDTLQAESHEQFHRRLLATPKRSPLREASAIIERLQHHQHGDDGAVRALIAAKQALDILATLEDGLHLREPVTLSRTETVEGPRWKAERGPFIHQGVSLVDALGQLCQVLAAESGE